MLEEDDETPLSLSVDELAHAWLEGWSDHNAWSSTPRGMLELWLPDRAYVSPTQFARMIAYLQQLIATDATYRFDDRFNTSDWKTPPAS